MFREKEQEQKQVEDLQKALKLEQAASLSKRRTERADALRVIRQNEQAKESLHKEVLRERVRENEAVQAY